VGNCQVKPSPYALIYDGIRWHVRAYCEKRQDYLDFVLSRFRGVPELLDSSEHGREQDSKWNTQVEVVVIPNPCQPLEQQEIIATDYAMQNRELHFFQRMPLVTTPWTGCRSAITISISSTRTTTPWC